MERESFLNWRRALAKEEESNLNYAITPFEKNIEVWRQLWLTVEKCHLLIQIVDGRNPLYFRCPDLERYIEDIDKNKDYILLINKADLMSKKVRKSWANYFKENGIKYIFFSALEEAKKIDEELENENKLDIKEDLSEAENDESDEEDFNQGNMNMFNKFKNLKVEDDEEDRDQVEADVELHAGVFKRVEAALVGEDADCLSRHAVDGALLDGPLGLGHSLLLVLLGHAACLRNKEGTPSANRAQSWLICSRMARTIVLCTSVLMAEVGTKPCRSTLMPRSLR
jgi:hypothetical protein